MPLDGFIIRRDKFLTFCGTCEDSTVGNRMVEMLVLVKYPLKEIKLENHLNEYFSHYPQNIEFFLLGFKVFFFSL